MVMTMGKRSPARIDRRHSPGILRKHGEKYLMMAPYLLLFLLFTIIPVLMSVVLGFTDFNLLEMPHFVGLENYRKLFLEDDVFLISVKNTLVFAFVTGPISYFLSLMLAWFINELRPAARAAFTFLFYCPSIAGNMYTIWSAIFSGDIYGLANSTLMGMGLINDPIKWLSDPSYMLGIIMVIQLWMSMGAGFLAFIAGLQNVDRSLYEAGALDGVRNRWQELIHITLPSMGPQLLFGAVMQISSSFAAGRICIALAGNPSTDYAANTIITHIVDFGTTRYEMGYASAIATILFAVMVLTNQFISRFLKRFT